MNLIKSISIIFLLTFMLYYNLNAQVNDNKLSKKNKSENNSEIQNKQNQQNLQNQNNLDQSTQVITPNFISGDIVFIYNAFNTIELKATEVDSFINSIEKLKIIVENPNFKKLSVDVPVKVDIEIQAAENILVFCNRITMTGANVIRYKRFVNAIYDAAKNQQ